MNLGWLPVESFGTPVMFDANVVVGVLRLRRSVCVAARPGVLTELITDVLNTNPALPVLLVRLTDADVDCVADAVFRAAGVKGGSAAGCSLCF